MTVFLFFVLLLVLLLLLLSLRLSFIATAMLSTMVTESLTATCPLAEVRPPEFKRQHVGFWAHQAQDLLNP